MFRLAIRPGASCPMAVRSAVARMSFRGYAKVRQDWDGSGQFVKRHTKAVPKAAPAGSVAVNAGAASPASTSKPITTETKPVVQPIEKTGTTTGKTGTNPEAQPVVGAGAGAGAGAGTSTQPVAASPAQPVSSSSGAQPVSASGSGSGSGSNSNSGYTSGKRHRALRIALVVGGIGVVLFLTSDLAHHIFIAYERIAVVTVATIRCFKLYKDTLDAEYASDAERNAALSRCHEKAAAITYKAVRRNGGIYIKLGQHLSALTYLLPKEWTDAMIPLQDQCPRSSMDEINKMFESDMGTTIDAMFSEFDPNPVGVASLAQVHVARLRDTGEKVAVKVQHPSLEEFVPLDVYVTLIVFRLMERVFPEYPLLWLGDEMQNSIYVELDFTKEAANAENTAEDFMGRRRYTGLRVPGIKRAEKRILIMEHVAGARLDDFGYLERHHIDPGQVSVCLSHIFNTMIFAPGVALHCDPHGGNLAIRYLPPDERTNGFNFEIVLYDHGLYRNLPLLMKRQYSHFWLAVLDKDIDAMRHWAHEFAGIDGGIKFEIFAAAITGRAPEVALNFDISKSRSDDEISHIQSRLNHEDGVLEGLMEILSTMPRLVLLILKTNDLTRNLDEGLHNPLGPVRTFLILASYCARTVFDESMARLNDQYSKVSLVGNFKRMVTWWRYQARVSQLYVYDIVTMVRNAVGM
ncbi:ABC1 family protein Mcp2p [Diutina catenulata]